jgi:hypothetical protein
VLSRHVLVVKVMERARWHSDSEDGAESAGEDRTSGVSYEVVSSSRSLNSPPPLGVWQFKTRIHASHSTSSSATLTQIILREEIVHVIGPPLYPLPIITIVTTVSRRGRPAKSPSE